MKMRFWQKTYIFTLILFLICMNAGILSLSVYTHKKNVDASHSAASSEQNYIAMSFERDLADMTAGSPMASVELLMQSYCNHYNNKGIYLEFSKDGEIVVSTLPFAYDGKIGRIRSIRINNERHVLISADIADGQYTLVYATSTQALDTEFRSLMVIYALTSLGVSSLLAVCLFFILKRLSEPLEKLRKTTEAVESGDLSVTAEESGSDEVAMLARSFNSMLGRINEQLATERKNAKEKQMLVDDLAHELRTPLTSIQGYAQLLERASDSEKNRITAAKYIISETQRLQKISQLLLDGAYIRENAPELCETDISAVLRDTAQRLAMKAKERGVRILCETEECNAAGNADLLSMLLCNLCENAIKACSAGGTVKLSCKDGSVYIADDGKGMSEEELAHITEPFYRTDKSRSRAEGGAGLGLYLCSQIAEVHSAKMTFSSKKGKGTTVRVDFTT